MLRRTSQADMTPQISYLISPILSFTVVGALQAAKAAIPE
jgi:hypothetical protein